MGGQKLIKKWSKIGQKLNKIEKNDPPPKKSKNLGEKLNFLPIRVDCRIALKNPILSIFGVFLSILG